MKISRKSLQEYFKTPLPGVAEIADAFTFHAFEIDSIEGDALDIKILPNRAHDCSLEKGIALELSAILNIPLKKETAYASSGAVAVRISLSRINGILGSDFSHAEAEDVFRRLRFTVAIQGDTFVLTPPSERKDIVIPEDIAEEVGRILGYDRLPAEELPQTRERADHARFRGIEKVKDFLVERGFTEISTQSFAKKGDILLANPLDKTNPALRANLDENMKKALAQAKQYAPLVLSPNENPKLFEIGNVFPKSGEKLEIATSESVSDLPAIQDENEYEPKRYTLGAYKPFSLYPFIVRDIALWIPAGKDEGFTKSIIRDNAGDLLVRIDKFDQFEKEGKLSLAFRLAFQSMERTLTDEEVNSIMTGITTTLSANGYEVR